jgi:hypothetical protein
MAPVRQLRPLRFLCPCAPCTPARLRFLRACAPCAPALPARLRSLRLCVSLTRARDLDFCYQQFVAYMRRVHRRAWRARDPSSPLTKCAVSSYLFTAGPCVPHRVLYFILDVACVHNAGVTPDAVGGTTRSRSPPRRHAWHASGRHRRFKWSWIQPWGLSRTRI